ncbi:hypothetical protein HY839_01080 [Candidatus Azambacteria bacterium]|nr:hypothetical protein [Candidatus Azambacteria bacterium]
MGNKNFESFPEAPAEDGENNKEEAEAVREGEIGTEEKVLPETPDELQEMDPEALESFKGVPEAPLEEDEA